MEQRLIRSIWCF